MNKLASEVKRSKKEREKTKKDLKREFEKFHSGKPQFDNVVQETETKISAVEYYNSLSDSEKQDFNREIQKKSVREHYVNYLKYVYGDKYVLTAFHRALANIAESIVRKVENGENIIVCLSVPPQFGKLLANDTPILTRNGWKKHGELVVGDEVLNPNGDFVKVKHIFPKQYANRKVIFTNGEEILCHENHEWVVFDRILHKQLVRETKFIEERVDENDKVGRGHRFRFQLPLTHFVKGETKELYVNPYVLGVWLGDGKRDCGTICACKEDEITLLECRKHYPQGFNTVHKQTGVLYKNFNGLTTTLKKYGLCSGEIKTKFIPQEYLTADIRQRLELLAGLLDTDGYLDIKHKRYYFTTSDIELRDTFCELVSTFGWRATIVEHKPTLSTSGIQGKKPFWVVGFNPTTFIPCRLKRKQLTSFSKQRKISICKVEKIGNIEGNCIEVEGGVYLCGKSLIPTHNSKTFTECLPSWFVMRNPDKGVILCSYNADFAEKFGDANRQKVKEFGKDLFGLEISDSQDNKTLFQIKKHEGQVLSTGIFGTLTGNPASILIIDDPYKSNLEAESADYRNKVLSVVKSSAETRLSPLGSALIIIHTRWHEEDLIGTYIKEDGVIYINIPCVWEKGEDKLLHRKVGEILSPELGHTTEWVNKKRKSLGNKTFSALYQGKPYIDGGNIVQRKDIKFYNNKSKPSVFEEITLSADLSFGEVKNTNDPSCITIWGRVGGDHYLLEIVNKRMTFTQTLEMLQYLCGKYPQMRKKLIEKKANGNATIEMLNQRVGGFIPFDPKGDSKEARLRLVTPYFEAGNVYFPEESVCDDIEEFIQQLLKFPSVAHDDFVDTISQYLLNYSYKYEGGRIGTDSRYALISEAIRGFKV